MPDPFELDKLPSSLQWAAIIGTTIAGFVTWLFSRRISTKPEPDVADLQLQLRTGQLQQDLQQVISAQTEAFWEQLRRERRDWEHELGALENRLRQLELNHARGDRRHRDSDRD